MPKAMERKLKSEAKKKGLTGDRADAYVYGTLRKTGWKPKTQKKSTVTKSTTKKRPVAKTDAKKSSKRSTGTRKKK